jgi:hypothetical protein
MSTFRTLCVLPLLGLVMFHVCASGQVNLTSKPETGRVLARLSYMSNYPTNSTSDYSPRICFELYRDGHYRESRMTRGATENVGGTLSQNDFDLITEMLKRLDFVNSGGGAILEGSESFAAEVAQGDEMKHYVWIDPDHKRPFPESAASVIDWLQAFKPQSGSPAASPEVTMDPICPRGGFRRTVCLAGLGRKQLQN